MAQIPARVSFLNQFRSLGIVAAGIGVLTLLGWNFGIVSLLTIIEGFPKMPPNTALAYVLAGVGLCISSHQVSSHGLQHSIGRFSALGVVLIGIISLVDYVSAGALKSQQFLEFLIAPLLRDQATATSPVSAFCLVLAGSALWLVGTDQPRLVITQQVMTLINLLVLLGIALSYLYGAVSVYDSSPKIGVSPASLATMVILCYGILRAHAHQGIMYLLTNSRTSGFAARWSILSITIMFVILGGVRLHAQVFAGWVTLEGGIAFLVTSTIATVMGVILWSANLQLQHETQIQEAQTGLFLSEQNFRTLTTTAPVGIFKTTPEGDCVFVNDTWQAITGLSANQALGTGWKQAIHPDDWKRIHQEWHATIETQGFFQSEYRFVRPDGEVIWVSGKGVPLRDEKNVVTGFIGVIVDITQRRTLEEALREREATFRILGDNLFNGAIFQFKIEPDGHRKFLYFSAGVEKLLGLAPETVMANPGVLFEQLDEKTKNQMNEAVEIALRTNTELDIQLPKHTPHRGLVWTQIRQSPFRLPDGSTIWNGIEFDITNQKHLETELIQAREAAEQASKTKSEFLATMSHEIRTPMNGVIGMCNLLLETQLTSLQREFAETIFRSGEALLTIINDILDLSKIEAGRLELETIDFQPFKVIETVLDLLAETAYSKKLELVLLVSPGVPELLKGDPTRLRQIITNLVGNAIKFTEHGTITIKLQVVDQTESTIQLRFEVADTGIGISDEAQTRLFQSFSQADATTTRRFGGTGLGLAICKKLVEAMNGHLNVTSEVGVGSSFWFEIPFEKSSHRPQLVGNLAASTPGQVLIVEEHPQTLELLEQALTGWNIKFDSASSTAAALRMLEQSRPDRSTIHTVVLDISRSAPSDDSEINQMCRACPSLQRLILIVPKGFGQTVRTSEVPGVRIQILPKPIRFTQLLKAFHEAGETSSATSPTPAKSGVEPLFEHRRILVAEDNPVNQQLITYQLKRFGLTTQIAPDGQAALDALSQGDYDLVLMDCQMPILDGYEVTRRYRQQAKGVPHIPIIALTANAFPENKRLCREAGMDDFLTKPVETRELERVLTTWLQHKPHLSTDLNLKSPTPAVAESVAVIDSATIAELRSLDSDPKDALLTKIIDLFLTDTPQLLDELAQAVKNQDRIQTTKLAHRLRGSSLTFGAAQVTQICSEIERQGLELPSETLTALVTRLEHEFEKVWAALREERKLT